MEQYSRIQYKMAGIKKNVQRILLEIRHTIQRGL